jgi:dienelactone hydrolase
VTKALPIAITLAGCMATAGGETLPPLADEKAPRTLEEMWAGLDPRAEPLDVEVLKEWEQDGVVLKVLRYRIGIFKGKKAMMAAVYGYPKGGRKLPGLVQIHGGGQYAHWNACFTNAKRGYATISISWAGRIDAPGYRVTPNEVKLFWDGKTDDPNYRLITDWGALDGYHAPSRYAHGFSRLTPHEHTLDAVESPRNDSWFLCTLGARRALTFLEQQRDVDGGRLGVYGHSMGGKLTVMTAGADDRVKAAAPSCGGVSHRGDKNAMLRATICDNASLKNISCPIMFLSPTNDFHGRIEDLQSAIKEIKSTDWRVTCAAHHQHQDTAEYEVATQLWMDKYLKGTFSFPQTPQAELTLDGENGVPSFLVRPDTSKEILAVDIFYTQQGDAPARDRFWHHVAPTQNSDAWLADVPLLSTDKPFWVYANVLYALDKPVTGAGYYYGTYTTSRFNLSSVMSMVTPEQLAAAGVKATLKPSPVIEDFAEDWEKEWFIYSNDPENWQRKTRKIHDDRYQAPAFAKLALEVRSKQPNKLALGLDKSAAEVKLEGGGQSQQVLLYPTDFKDAEGGVRLDWEGIKELRLSQIEHLRPKDGKPLRLGAEWQGEAPEFRSLRWVNGTREELNARREVRLLDAPVVDGKTYIDIKYADHHIDGYKSTMNAWLDGKPLVIDGKPHAHGLTTHAAGEILFFLGGKFKRFRAIAQAWKSATITFEVHVDDKKVLDSGLLTRWKTTPVDLSVEHAQELKLVVTDGGNGKGGDHGSWVDAHLLQNAPAQSKAALPTPPEVWQDYDPEKGAFSEEIVKEKTQDGIYYRESYVSAYVNGEETRVFCKYSVKAGVENAPGLLDVHGWYGQPNISLEYVKAGWAVLAHDYAGREFEGREHYTKYPEKLSRGNMKGPLVNSKLRDGASITDPSQTSDYVWYALQRRALSYLLAQKEVDPNRIGAKGYSYGGTIMWNLGIDPRVKAIVAYFGVGWLEYYRTRSVWLYNTPYREPEKSPGEELYLSAIAPQAHAPYITAASLWLNGTNDHHGGHERGEQTFKMFKPVVPWAFAHQARGHHNTEKLGQNCKLWLEKHVLGKDIPWPERPKSEIALGMDGVPELHVTPASPEKITEFQAYYALKNPVSFGRSWRDAEATRTGDTWVVKMPVLNVDDYVFAFANIRYAPDIVVSSDFTAAVPAKLGKAVATDSTSDIISEGTGVWSNVAPVEGVGGVQGFRVLNRHHGTVSEQFSDPKWRAPADAQLSFKFYCTQPQALMLVVNGWYETDIEITASDEWQEMVIKDDRLTHRGNRSPLDGWSRAAQIQIKPKAGSDITKVIFSQFKWLPLRRAPQETHQDGRLYLTKEMASKAESFHRLMNNRAWEGTAISVGGKAYTRGLGVHANSEIVFPLDGRYTGFHVVPGPDDAHKGLVEMEIQVDGKEVFASGKVRSAGYKARDLSIPVKGAVTLTLIVTDGGDGKGGDHASWADAYLTGGGQK